MFITSVAYDYYKSFVTTFIEVARGTQVLFGKPNMSYVVPIVNCACVFETFMFLLFDFFLIIHLAVGRQFSLFIVLSPLYLMFTVFLVGMTILYILFCLYMFLFVEDKRCIFPFIVALPLGYINLFLFFGFPIISLILIPVQRELRLLPSTRLFDVMIYVILGLVGSFLKGFIRPSDDVNNPFYSKDLNIEKTILYYSFVTMMGIFLLIMCFNVDERLPVVETFFKIPWIVVFLPLFFVEILALCFFTYKVIRKIKDLTKNNMDTNGNEVFLTVTFAGCGIFTLLAIVQEILIIINLSAPQLGMNLAGTLCLLPVSHMVMMAISILPFFPRFHKRVGPLWPSKEDIEEKKKREEERREQKKDDDDDDEDNEGDGEEMLTLL